MVKRGSAEHFMLIGERSEPYHAGFMVRRGSAEHFMLIGEHSELLHAGFMVRRGSAEHYMLIGEHSEPLHVGYMVRRGLLIRLARATQEASLFNSVIRRGSAEQQLRNRELLFRLLRRHGASPRVLYGGALKHRTLQADWRAQQASPHGLYGAARKRRTPHADWRAQ
jgi:hypothetical protein